MAVDDAYTIVNTGAQIATSATSATVALPIVSGSVPKYCRISCSQAAYIKVGPAGITATANDLLLMPSDCVVLRTHGLTTLAALQVNNPGVVQVSPLEDN